MGAIDAVKGYSVDLHIPFKQGNKRVGPARLENITKALADSGEFTFEQASILEKTFRGAFGNFEKAEYQNYLEIERWGREIKNRLGGASGFDAFVDPAGTFDGAGQTPVYDSVAEAVNGLLDAGITTQFIGFVGEITATDSEAIASGADEIYLIKYPKGLLNLEYDSFVTDLVTWDTNGESHALSSVDLYLFGIDWDMKANYTVANFVATDSVVGDGTAVRTLTVTSATYITHSTVDRVGVQSSTGSIVFRDSIYRFRSTLTTGSTSASSPGSVSFRDVTIIRAGSSSQTLTITGGDVSLLGIDVTSPGGSNPFTLAIICPIATGLHHFTMSTAQEAGAVALGGTTITVQDRFTHSYMVGNYHVVTLNNDDAVFVMSANGLTLNGDDNVGVLALTGGGSLTDNGTNNRVWPNSAITSGSAAGGDLSGTYPNPSVVDDSHNHTGTTISALDAGDTTTGIFAEARLGSGTGDSTKFLRGDSTWQLLSSIAGSLDHGALLGLGDDDHTQYALLLGRSGGQTLIGGTADGNTLTLESNSVDPSGDQLIFNSGISLFPTGQTYTVAPEWRVRWSGTHTMDFAGVVIQSAIDFQPTIELDQSGFGFLLGNLFWSRPIIKNVNGEANTWGPFIALLHSPTYQADGATVTLSGTMFGVRISPTVNVINSGTMNMADMTAYSDTLTIATGGTVITRKGYEFSNATGAGTLQEQIGIDIATLAKGSTNIGIRNASTEVATPTNQNITAVTQAITATAKHKTLTADASYTLTSAPTIADGQDGQILIITNEDTTDTITLQDQGTLASSNLRLGANTRALGPRDSIILIFNSTIGDWVELAFSNVL